MDLSLTKKDHELWEHIRSRFSGPIGVVPHYLLFNDKHGIKEDALLNRIDHLFKNGINFITIHCTPSFDMYMLAKKSRYIPMTSRGGGIILKDMEINNRVKNIYEILFDDICDLAVKYGATINLGTTFRAGSVADGFDEVVKMEITKQINFCKIANIRGAKIVLEGPGHILLSDICKYWNIVKNLKVPLMPLGPIVSDIDDELDHISATIGSSYLMMLSRGGIINVITAVEHKGGVPGKKSLLEGLRYAKFSAHISSSTYNNSEYSKEKEIAMKRSKLKSCTIKSRTPGCVRCGSICPLMIDV